MLLFLNVNKFRGPKQTWSTDSHQQTYISRVKIQRRLLALAMRGFARFELLQVVCAMHVVGYDELFHFEILVMSFTMK